MRVQWMRTSLVYPGIAGYGFGSLGKGMEAGWVSHGLAHLSSAAKAKGCALRIGVNAGSLEKELLE